MHKKVSFEECFKHARVMNTQAFSCRKCFMDALVENIRASPSRECFKHAPVVVHRFAVSRVFQACLGNSRVFRLESACGEYTSKAPILRSVSSIRLTGLLPFENASADDKELSDSTKTSQNKFGRQLELDTLFIFFSPLFLLSVSSPFSL